jgi:hypothetical protein
MNWRRGLSLRVGVKVCGGLVVALLVASFAVPIFGTAASDATHTHLIITLRRAWYLTDTQITLIAAFQYGAAAALAIAGTLKIVLERSKPRIR